MALHYTENPLLFVNSSDGRNDGRNVRAQLRAQQAAAQQSAVPAASGHFTVLNFKPKRVRVEEDAVPKRRRTQCKKPNPNGTRDRALPPTSSGSLRGPLLLYTPSQIQPLTFNPSEILAVATFHIRRVGAIMLRKHPDRLSNVLRCRQWSCVSVTPRTQGQISCIEYSLLCIKQKLRQMTGGYVSDFAILSNYTKALQTLRAALLDAPRNRYQELITTTQLLAVYEMLESLDNSAWLAHIAGAESLSLSHVATDGCGSLTEIVPIVTDAFLCGNINFFKCYNWRGLLQSAFSKSKPSKDPSELASSLWDVPDLLIDADEFSRSEKTELTAKYALLDRAHVLRARVRNELLDSDLSAPDYTALASFDKLALFLAALLGLERTMDVLHPMVSLESENDQIGDLCTQLLQIELGAMNANPATALMSAFQLSN